ncbi:MAG TPA: Ig-like domain-containing protein [Gemmatimonadaceae bacterium]|nr:Ig-like domain-containing protein [Gemmatimonadaceae bacterium]
MRAPLTLGILAVGVMGCGSGSTAPPGSVAQIIVTPDTSSIPGGATVTLTASAHSASGQTVSGVTIFWSTSDNTIAAVSQSGVVTALANGTARIAASAQNHSGFATVIVQPLTVATVTLSPTLDTIYATAPSNTVTLVATTRDAAGTVLTGQSLIWSETGGVVNVANGVVTATNTAAGTATVTATSPDPGLPSGSATVVVIGHAKTVTVSPANPTISVHGVLFPTTVQLSAAITDTFGTDVTAHRTVTWASSNPSVATVSATGLVTAVGTSSSSATITATTTDGIVGSTVVNVTL